MGTSDYRRALDAAVREYEALGAQRRAIDERLAQLAQTIGTLNRLCGYVPTVPWGLTDACRLVLRNAGSAMTPTDVRDRLAAIGFDMSRYANGLAAIHTVLKRLRAAGDAEAVKRGDGRAAYAWRAPAAARPADWPRVQPDAPSESGSRPSRKNKNEGRR